MDAISVFFRDPSLADAIGFRYHADDPMRAAEDFLHQIKERFVRRLAAQADRVLTVALDGENAWGAYRDDGRPFLHALYERSERDDDVRTVTFAEYLDGNADRGVAPHPMDQQVKVYDLFAGSWIDEPGSERGVDLGTWIGEREENRAWMLLGQAHDALDHASADAATWAAAFEALAFAEGSDWFWWFGEDQNAGWDDVFDELFRARLCRVCRALHVAPPPELDQAIVPRVVVWSFADQIPRLQLGDRLLVRANCPGVLTWSNDGERGEPGDSPAALALHNGDNPDAEAALSAVGGAMAGVRRHQLTLGPFPPGTGRVRFRFRCTQPGCSGGPCCSSHEHVVAIGRSDEGS
jgi:hypothetical protein